MTPKISLMNGKMKSFRNFINFQLFVNVVNSTEKSVF